MCSLPHLENLTLADPTFHKPGKVDLLIGVEAWADIIIQESKTGKAQEPMAQRTIFGWAIVGWYTPDSLSLTSLPSPVHVTASHESTDAILLRFWESEDISSSATLTPEEKLVVSHFNNHHSYLPAGRYKVALPRGTGTPALGESRKQALQRFQSKSAQSSGKETGPPFRRWSRSTWILATPSQCHRTLLPLHLLPTTTCPCMG